MTSNVALVGLARDLEERAKTGKPIRIGLIGAGEMAPTSWPGFLICAASKSARSLNSGPNQR